MPNAKSILESKAHVARRKEAQQDRSQQKVERILKAALATLANGPFEKISTKGIAKAAGVSVGTLYRFFPNKEAVLYELYRRWLHQNLETLDRLIDTLGPDTTIEEFTDSFLAATTDPVLNSPGNWHLRLAVGASPKLAMLEEQHRAEVVQRIAKLQMRFGTLPDSQTALDVMRLQNEVTIACLFSISLASGPGNKKLLMQLCRTLFLLIFDYETWQKS